VQRLNNQTLRSLSNAVDPPRYDRDATRVGIAHIGIGAFHRSHQAMFLDRLRRLGGHEDWGIAGIGLFPAEASTLDRLRPKTACSRCCCAAAGNRPSQASSGP
jgi:mannitol 2-dehydrogenase